MSTNAELAAFIQSIIDNYPTDCGFWLSRDMERGLLQEVQEILSALPETQPALE